MADWFNRKADGTLEGPTDWKGWALLGALGLVDLVAIVALVISLATSRVDAWMLAVWIVFVGASLIVWLALKRGPLFSKAKR